MKKFAVTALAVFYTLLILSATVVRTNEWAVQEAAALAHSGHDGPCVSAPEKSESPAPPKKIFERQFIVEAPLSVVAVLTSAGDRVLLQSLEYHSIWSGRPLSSRAPPALA